MLHTPSRQSKSDRSYTLFRAGAAIPLYARVVGVLTTRQMYGDWLRVATVDLNSANGGTGPTSLVVLLASVWPSSLYEVALRWHSRVNILPASAAILSNLPDPSTEKRLQCTAERSTSMFRYGLPTRKGHARSPDN